MLVYPHVTQDSGYESAIFWVLALFDRFPTGINLQAVQKGNFRHFVKV